VQGASFGAGGEIVHQAINMLFRSTPADEVQTECHRLQLVLATVHTHTDECVQVQQQLRQCLGLDEGWEIEK